MQTLALQIGERGIKSPIFIISLLIKHRFIQTLYMQTLQKYKRA